MDALTHIAKVNDDQVAFGARLGLDLRGCTVSVAAARIEDAIARGFYGVPSLGAPTDRQVAFAAQYGYDISQMTRAEGGAVVDGLMTELNLRTIECEELTPGVVVSNIHAALEQQYIISSISPDGTVYFRGGNGQRAWARSLRRVAAVGG